jgi:hypothetical protein
VFGGGTLPGRAQHHAEHLPAQGLGGGAGRTRVCGEEARELIGWASHQVPRGAVEEHDGEDAVAGGNGEEQAVHAGGRRGGLPAGEAGSGQAREREMAEWAGEVGEVGGVGRHDSAERRRPRRSRTAAGAAADEGHLRFVQPRLKSPRRVSFCGPLVPAVAVGGSASGRSICTVHCLSHGQKSRALFWIGGLCTFLDEQVGDSDQSLGLHVASRDPAAVLLGRSARSNLSAAPLPR